MSFRYGPDGRPYILLRECWDKAFELQANEEQALLDCYEGRFSFMGNVIINADGERIESDDAVLVPCFARISDGRVVIRVHPNWLADIQARLEASTMLQVELEGDSMIQLDALLANINGPPKGLHE